MKYAKRKIWINPDRCLCELEEDGTVTFKNDLSFEESKWAIGAILREAEKYRQSRIDEFPVINLPGTERDKETLGGETCHKEH